jgi:cytochrome c-type biogenesis protein CcmH
MRTRLAVMLALIIVVVAVPAAAGAEPRFTMDEIESELMCPTCQSRLDLSYSPAADRIRVFIEERRQAGWTKDEVKDALVEDFGPGVLAAPPAEGIGLVAWGVPLLALAVGLLAVLGVGVAWRRRARVEVAAGTTDPALDARIDDELRRLADEDR